MAAKKKGFVLYYDACKELECLEPEQRGWVLTAAYRFALACEEREAEISEVLKGIPQLTPEAQMACRFLCGNIQRDTRKWCERREHYIQAAQKRKENRTAQEDAWKYVEEAENPLPE